MASSIQQDDSSAPKEQSVKVTKRTFCLDANCTSTSRNLHVTLLEDSAPCYSNNIERCIITPQCYSLAGHIKHGVAMPRLKRPFSCGQREGLGRCKPAGTCSLRQEALFHS
ncbi:unnamed protein product [Urochloa humidicola]